MVFAGALVVTVIVPETFAPEAGNVTETVGAGLFGVGLFGTGLLTLALAPPPQPTKIRAADNSKHSQGTAHGWAFDLHASLVGELIEPSWFMEWAVPVWFQCRYHRSATARLRRDSNPRHRHQPVHGFGYVQEHLDGEFYQ